MNLCSKCFADIQKKQPGEDLTSKPIQSTGTSQSPVFSSDSSSSSSSISSISSSSSSSSQSLLSSPPSNPEQPSAAEEPSSTCPSTREAVSSTETAQGTLCTPTKRPRESASGSESEATPEKRPRPNEKEGGSEEAGGATPKQKNRRRCYRCQTKLELVQQELGSCRCGYVFCMLHRLPEQHDCLFDHLGRGREEAVLKMVKLDRKVGRSCQRIGEECS
ncbi:AN1-type zinc finger protein 3-like isoform X2 [Cynoglossus semilaevis]|nr:AN1-type zinc finger protein 3-like isoform X2 [Cynoglossus semilaevis]